MRFRVSLPICTNQGVVYAPNIARFKFERLNIPRYSDSPVLILTIYPSGGRWHSSPCILSELSFVISEYICYAFWGCVLIIDRLIFILVSFILSWPFKSLSAEIILGKFPTYLRASVGRSSLALSEIFVFI